MAILKNVENMESLPEVVDCGIAQGQEDGEEGQA